MFPSRKPPPIDESYLGTQYEGRLGLAALKRLDLIVDGTRGVAHLRPKTTPPGPYQHNRAGLAALPSPSNTNVYIAARVVEGGPAWEAGVRTGDTLLKCNGKSVSPTSKHSEDLLREDPGTKLVLTVERGKRTLDITVTLRQIVPPRSP
jgi:S1-C subfamily serine protease